MPRKRKTPKRGSSQGQPSQQQGHGQPQQASLECQPQHGTEQILEQQGSNQQERHPQQASQGISYAQPQHSDSRRRKAPKERSFQGQPSQRQGSERPQPASQEDQSQTLQCLQQGLRQEEGPGQPYQGQASVLPQIEQGEGSEPEGGHGRGRGRGLVEVKREIEDTRPASDLPIDSYSSFVPVRPSFPELPQAVQSSSPPFEQNVAGVETQAQSSVDILKPSLLPSAGGPSLEERLQMLSLQVPKREVGSSSQGLPPPVSSKLMQFPLRPGKGQNGVKCIVKANHFFADLPDKDLHQYDVTIMPEVTSRAVNRVVMGQLVELYREIYLGGRLPVYDGRKSVYTAGPLPFISKDFTINLVDKDNETDHPRRERQFKVAIKFAAKADLHHLRQFLSGMQADAPQEALQVLDIVLRELPSQRYSPFGASFYSPRLGQRASLGGGLERWPGFYQSIRPTQMGLSLNIDMSSTAFIEPLPVIEFIVQLLNKNVGLQPLSDVDYVKIKKALRGVKIEVTHRGNMRRKYRISGLTLQPTQQLKFPLDNKSTMKSVVEYFQETYGYTIQYSQLPCLQAGNPQKPIYLPMEVCKIVEGQRYSKRLNEKQITALLRDTCQRPQEREKSILQIVHHNAYDQDPYAKEFGIKISDELATVEARILPAPRLKYHDSGKESDCTPRVGQWNMMNKKLVNGGTVNYWACISFSRTVDEIAAHLFCQDLGQMCETSGMTFNKNPIIPILSGRPEQVESTLKRMQRDTKSKLREKQLELLIVILPENNGSLYGDVKRICETDLGIVSQCCLTKPVFRRNKQYLANVALKINVKVGGRNTVLVDALSRKISHVSDMPTIIFGADVTHPSPGEDLSPSIAAVVASQDWPEVTKYAVLVSAQPYRQELIQDLFKVVPDPKGAPAAGGMIRDLMISFRNATGQKPKRIIFYRDGVSESQFNQVLLHELEAIRKACRSLEKGYEPPVTFVVVQKRHHTRLFANNHCDRATVDTSGNILPGTVVDTKICHPTQFDFYLCSHAGIQGTSRPTHYHVIWDENNFMADDLQSLTNKLCYTYARCTRSVSIVPPAYYAHLAAFRARFYMERETSDSTSLPSEVAGKSMPVISGSRSSYLASGASVQPLPPIKENVKKVMFYC